MVHSSGVGAGRGVRWPERLLLRRVAQAGSGKLTVATRGDLGKLRGLAAEKGYRLEKAPVRGCWFLINEKTGVHALSPRDTTAFGVASAIRFLRNLDEVPATITIPRR